MKKLTLLFLFIGLLSSSVAFGQNVGYASYNYFSGFVNSPVTRILKTTDGGATWNNPSTGGAAEVVGTNNTAKITFPSDNIGYLSYNYFSGFFGSPVTRILKTIDGGATWNDPGTNGVVEIVGTNDSATIVFSSNNIGYLSYKYFNFSLNSFVTRILKTTDGGATWGDPGSNGAVEIAIGSVPDNPSISFPKQTITSTQKLPTLQDKISLEVFPNPTNTTTNIIVEDYQDKVYSVLNIMGQEVMQGQLQSNQTTLDLTALATKGTYLILIKEKQNGQVLAKKMIALQ